MQLVDLENMTSDELYDFIVDVQSAKKEAGLHPTHIRRYELFEMLPKDEIYEPLNELIRNDRIKVGDTMNDLYYEPKSSNKSS